MRIEQGERVEKKEFAKKVDITTAVPSTIDKTRYSFYDYHPFSFLPFQYYRATQFEKYTTSALVANRRVKYTIWDTAGKNISIHYIYTTQLIPGENQIQFSTTEFADWHKNAFKSLPQNIFLGLTLCSSV